MAKFNSLNTLGLIISIMGFILIIDGTIIHNSPVYIDLLGIIKMGFDIPTKNALLIFGGATIFLLGLSSYFAGEIIKIKQRLRYS